MVLLQDGIIAFLSAVGLTTVVWLAAGTVLHAGRPAFPGLMLVLPLRGEALALEGDFRELRRVRHRLPGSRIVLADCCIIVFVYVFVCYLAEREENVILAEGNTFPTE